MEFHLVYRGSLAANGTPKQKQAIRREFNRQLAVLWRQRPLVDQPEFLNEQPTAGKTSLLYRVGAFTFVPLVNARISLVAKIDILLLRPAEPGAIVRHGGDIDNRLKTLLDALRMPSASELPPDDHPATRESPFFCLLEDDSLITGIAVDTDRLLEDVPRSYVELVIRVATRASRVTWDNIGLSG